MWRRGLAAAGNCLCKFVLLSQQAPQLLLTCVLRGSARGRGRLGSQGVVGGRAEVEKSRGLVKVLEARPYRTREAKGGVRDVKQE